MPSLEAGVTLGQYRILDKLGEGGMGEVWSAQDARLGREVAIKVLPAEVAADPERRARFEREAKAVAALNHPNIVVLHAVEEAGGQLCLVMERVRGRTLAALIPPSGLPTAELLRLAVPLADAVGAAHQQGIVHRDLKPHNVMVTDEGRLKVLDFGLARFGEGEPAAGAPTATATAEGRILGTVAYMSPEQAQGLRVDARSDIFSLGVVLFEMASGRPPFAGASSAERIAAILRDAPPLALLRTSLPAGFLRAVRRCLEKDPARRYQSAIDLRHDLEEAAAAPPDAALGPRSPARVRLIGVALAALSAGALGATLVASRRAPPPPPTAPSRAPSVTRLQQLTSDEGAELWPSLSPDGSTLVYASRAAGNWDLYRKRVGGENAMNLTADCPDDDREPALSPDGERIAYRSERDGGGIFVMGATGEAARRVTAKGHHPRWAPDGAHLLVSAERVDNPRSMDTNGGVWLVDIATGDMQRLAGDHDSHQPAVSPDGRRVATWQIHRGGVRDLQLLSLAGAPPVSLTDDPALEWCPTWSPDGRWLYYASDARGGMSLMRLLVDGPAGTTPELLSTGAGGWHHSPSLSADGKRIAFVSSTAHTTVERIRFDPVRAMVEGHSERLAAGSLPVLHGDLVAFSAPDPEDVAVVKVDGTGRRRLTVDPAKDRPSGWLPDGRILFKSDRSGKYQCWAIRTDGSGLVQLSDEPEGVGGACVPAPDGAWVGFVGAKGIQFVDPAHPRADLRPPIPLRDGIRPYMADASRDGKTLYSKPSLASGEFGRLSAIDFQSGAVRPFGPVGANPVPGGSFADGRRLLITHEGDLRLIDTTTGRTRTLLSGGDSAIRTASLSADERWIVYDRRIIDADIWLATLE